jgi:predicted metal-dependent HD superfamily phosphohydrolase
VLRAFLARPRIFATAPFFAAYETRARRNLSRALSALEHTAVQ